MAEEEEEEEEKEKKEAEAEGVGLGEKNRPRRVFDDLEAKWAGTGNLMISFITHPNRELAKSRGKGEGEFEEFAKATSTRVSQRLSNIHHFEGPLYARSLLTFRFVIIMREKQLAPLVTQLDRKLVKR